MLHDQLSNSLGNQTTFCGSEDFDWIFRRRAMSRSCSAVSPSLQNDAEPKLTSIWTESLSVRYMLLPKKAVRIRSIMSNAPRSAAVGRIVRNSSCEERE